MAKTKLTEKKTKELIASLEGIYHEFGLNRNEEYFLEALRLALTTFKKDKSND